MMIAFHTLPGVCLECAGPLHDEDVVLCVCCNDHVVTEDYRQAHQQHLQWLWWLALIPLMTLAWIVVLIWMLLF